MSLRAAGIESFGGDVALLELGEPPPLEAGEVLIQVKAAGVANWDEIVRTGAWDVGRVPPLALGVAAAGEVVGVGPSVEWPATGAGVTTHPLPLRYQGCWADRLVAPAHLVAEKPDNASWAEAGAFPVPALTAEQVVSEALDVRPGETILVNGAGGVTGGMIVELAAHSGATVIATASTSSAERVMALGAHLVLDYRDPEWTSHAMDAAGSSGIRAAANAAPGGEVDALRALVNGGRLATITGAPPPKERGISIADVIVRPDGHQLRLLAASLAENKLHVDIAASYSLAQAEEALARALEGTGGAAVVVEP
ncbi:MAG TPA: NADP-dependent oxidoreductase [Thermoleophilaceae bacterium]|nr:NADP-dependent oxidoreductase [Thermoleophilaceae bacterium]